MKPTEMEIIRALSVKLGEDLVMYVSYQYHTEKDPTSPDGRKKNHSASRYRMIARVEKIKDVEEKIKDMHSPEKRMDPWKWPDDPTWQGEILYMKNANLEGFSNWLRLKLRKAVDPDTAKRIMAGYKKNPNLNPKKKFPAEELYSVFVKNAVYDTKGYTCSDGSTVDLDDFETLKTKVGQNIWKEIEMKTVGCKGA